MSDDLAVVEAELEALMAALELAGVLAGQARDQAVRVAKRLTREAPTSRADWDHRAQLNSDGKNLGWLDTKDARRVNLTDASGAKDQLHAPAHTQEQIQQTQQAPEVSEIVEVEGQFFAVTHAAGTGRPEQVEAISAERARALLEQHRPEIGVDAGEEGMSLVESRQTSAPQEAATRPASSRSPEEAPTAAPGGARRSAAAAFGAAENYGPDPAEVVASRHVPTPATASR
ncbi:hypothetical protein [Kocuria marina]|uniref:hypothetical protein n=1 Tax=Kocuria marina TaxID=223184 RepID=UPI0022E739D4|nr:hypothetical protein [Kocuria marina]